VPNKPQLIQYTITAVIILLVLGLRMRSVRRERPLKLEQLWIVPALYGAVAIFMFWRLPPHGLGWLWVGIALIVGGALGWWRGTHMAIRIDPETHRLNQRGSVMAVAVIVVLLMARFGLRELAMRGEIHMDVATLTDVLFASALGLFSMTRLEMFLRARQMLATARAATA
jgi:hypothetical protein